MEQELLEKLHVKELEMLKEIERICNENDIRWHLACGSVLGAVRHGGFIPWDDDIDIYMLDYEYEKFVKACEKDKVRDKFFLQTIDTDKNLPVPWAKIRLNNTCSMDKAFRDKKLHWGICIDIFRLQYAPRDDKKLKMMLKLKWFYSGICQMSFEKCPSVKSLVKFIKFFVLKILRLVPFRKLIEKKIKSYSKETDYARMCDEAGMRVFPSDFFEKKTMVKFEDLELPCPYQPERYLKMIYGDWKKLPEVDKRYGHSDIIVDTEKSYEIYQN